MEKDRLVKRVNESIKAISIKHILSKVAHIAIIISAASILSGCKAVHITEPIVEDAEFRILKKNELVERTYYVKDGATFRSLYNADTNEEIVNVLCSFDAIPTLYKNECIVYWDSNSTYSTSLALTRLKSIGYNFGIYNGYIDAKGNYVASLNDIVNESSARNVLTLNTGEIEVYEIDDKPIEKEMVYNGILGGNKYFGLPAEHQIHFFKGTKNYSYTITNDVFSLAPMENYVISNAELTTNGYIQFTLNNDMKSGYYYIENIGLFRYVNAAKETVEDIRGIDYYEPLYNVINVIDDIKEEPSDEITINDTTTYHTYSIQIAEKKNNFEFIAYYKEMAEIPYIALKSPLGEIYSLSPIEGQNASSILMSEAGIGEWQILVNNDLIQIIDVVAKEKEEKVVTKEVTKEFEFKNLSSSYKVSVSYKNGSIANAYITNEITNEADILLPINDSTYEFTYKYLTGGKFKVIVICDEKTDIDITMTDCSNFEKETLVFD